MNKEQIQIKEIVDRETMAWDTKNTELLVSIFHPDMVWPWPKTSISHDPVDWEFILGKFDRDRWITSWQQLFDKFELIHNKRKIVKIVISDQKDAAFAVVDIDTLWVDKDNKPNHWKGRVCKVYSKIGSEWKMTMHTGVLEY